MEFLAGDVQELAPFVNIRLLVCGAFNRLSDAICLRLWCRRAVDQLENERSAGNDAGASRLAVEVSLVVGWSYENSQISAHNVLQYGTLSTGLRPYDSDLREIDRVLNLYSSMLAWACGCGSFAGTHPDCGKNIL